MRLKNFTIKATCGNCGHPIINKSALVNLDIIESTKALQDELKSLFPEDIKCRCGNSNNIVRSYSYWHEHRFDTFTHDDVNKEIERAKAQIAATYDTNNDMSKQDREAVREAFQNQLLQLLEKNNML